MRIVYCIHSTYNSGGMEAILSCKVNYLQKNGYEVVIVTTEQNARANFFSLEKEIRQIDLEINYSQTNGSLFLKLLKWPWKQYIHRKKLTVILDALNPDIVISMFGNEASFLPKIHKKSRKILEIHFSKFFRLQYGRRGLWRILDKYRTYSDERIVRKYDKFVCLTNEDKTYWKNVTNIQVIPNFLKEYPSHIARLNNLQVIAVGRLSYQKGFERLIDIWKLVVQENSAWNLKIFGSGELYFQILDMIKEKGLEKNIEVLNPTSRIYDELLDSSIFVLTSRYEGLPMVLLEALSCGLPVVSFDCQCGPKDLISDGINGFLVENGNIEDFAKKIILLMENKELRKEMGKKARFTANQYSEEKIMNQWVELFKTL